MKKNILTIWITALFILLILSPFVFATNISISNKVIHRSTVSDDGGLMNSSWPMFQHDIHHTGRSPYGKSGNWFKVKWNRGIGSLTYSSPAIDKNGTIYIGSNDWYFRAIYPNSSLKWKYKTEGGISSSPAISEDGTIYVGSEDGRLYAFYPNGTLRWKISIGGWSWPPVIDEDGIIYTGSSNGKIYAVYPNGTKKWTYQTGDFIEASCVLDDNGTLYCGSHDNYMYAIYRNNGTFKWKYGAGSDCGGSGATVGDDGTIYFGDLLGYLHAVNPNGTRKWRKDLEANIYSTPSITEEGNIITGNYYGYIFSFNPDTGKQNWKFQAGGWISGSPTIDKYGIIYIGSVNGWFYALNPDGTLKWKYKASDEIFTSAAIDENGTIYFGAHTPTIDARLYALEIINTNPPDKPIIDGPSSGLTNTEYTYTATTIDPDGDNISYFFNWGDLTNSGWTDFVPSGTSINLSHIWKFKGTYTIRVKAKDVNGLESEWGTFTIYMPRDKSLSNTILLRFLERFPLFQKLLFRL